MSTEIGIGISRPGWRLRFGIDTSNFDWTPGEYESGNSTPAEFFDAGSDMYVIWTWLWFKVFFARCA